MLTRRKIMQCFGATLDTCPARLGHQLIDRVMERPLDGPDSDTDHSSSKNIGLGMHAAIEASKKDTEQVNYQTKDRQDLGWD